MRIELHTSDGTRVPFDPKVGGFNCTRTIPCMQCGTCCSRYQAPIGIDEAGRIAAQLGILLGAFLKEYVQPYPMRSNEYLIRHKDGGCLFLRREGSRAYCSIHEFKPDVCQAWIPSLERKECREGLKQLGATTTPLLRPSDLNLSTENLAAFCDTLRDQNTENANEVTS
ncbi:MAG: YkgJ family cysteine cluster protein [Chloroflexi bacterium]|nr:YkgJ family cysteine cluster protein [Chloroflexota bacterium]